MTTMMTLILDVDTQRGLLSATIGSSSYVPPAPPFAMTQALAAGACADPLVVADLLDRDPLLASATARTLRSPSYACEGRDLFELMCFAGAARTRDAMREAALAQHVFRAPGLTDVMVRARNHSFAVAHAARAIALHACVDPDAAFELALFHDAGLGALLQAVAQNPLAFPRARQSTLSSLVGELHEEAGRQVALAWKLSPRVASIIAKHHNTIVDEHSDPLLAVLVVAEAFANDQGFAIDVIDTHNAFDPAHHSVDVGLRALGIGSLARARVEVDVDAALRAARASA